MSAGLHISRWENETPATDHTRQETRDKTRWPPARSLARAYTVRACSTAWAARTGICVSFAVTVAVPGRATQASRPSCPATSWSAPYRQDAAIPNSGRRALRGSTGTATAALKAFAGNARPKGYLHSARAAPGAAGASRPAGAASAGLLADNWRSWVMGPAPCLALATVSARAAGAPIGSDPERSLALERG